MKSFRFHFSGAWRTDEFFGELFLGYFPTTTNRTFAPTLDRLGSLVSANQLKKWQKWSDNGRLFHINHTDVLHRSNLDSLDRRVTICVSCSFPNSVRVLKLHHPFLPSRVWSCFTMSESMGNGH